MPAMGIRHEGEIQTRDRFTKVTVEIGIKLNGKELPNMAVVGESLEEVVALIEAKIKKSYEVVPERVAGATPMANPYHTPQEVETNKPLQYNR